MTSVQLSVREMTLGEVGLRISYFHDASDGYLSDLGVDRARLPSPDEWLKFYEEDYQRPIELRANYSLLWELDGRIVGFSTTDRIKFGVEAFMHLHVTDPDLRRRGLGTLFVAKSARKYFEVLQLERLYCEPSALNVAPNRTLQRAGFRYLFSHEVQPTPINYRQITTRWVIERHQLSRLPVGDTAHLDEREMAFPGQGGAS